MRHAFNDRYHVDADTAFLYDHLPTDMQGSESCVPSKPFFCVELPEWILR